MVLMGGMEGRFVVEVIFRFRFRVIVFVEEEGFFLLGLFI